MSELQRKVQARMQKEHEAAELAQKHAAELAAATAAVIVQEAKPVAVAEPQVVAPKPVKPRAPRPNLAPAEPTDEPVTPRETGARGYHMEFLRGLYELVTGKRNRDMTRKELEAWLREYKGDRVIYLVI